jgi:hypothetical protein
LSKAEKFISEHTRKLTQYEHDYFLWVTPDDARKAVEIAREEVIEKTLNFLKDRLYKNGYVGIIDLCDDYIKAMKDE